MSIEAWLIFAGFWVVFVTSPGPNAANCILNGMTHGFARALWGVAAILTQALTFLLLSAAGITALIAASPQVFLAAKIAGALVLVWLGLRGWLRAGTPLRAENGNRAETDRAIYLRALAIATINPKSVAGYLAAFTQFVEPGVPIGQQMGLIVPTALAITAASYTTWTALGAGLGKAALGALGNLILRRVLAGSFILYGVLLGATTFPGGSR